jgi:hypothetical protein
MRHNRKTIGPSMLKRTIVALALGLILTGPMASTAFAAPDRGGPNHGGPYHGRPGDERGRGYDRDWRAHETHARGYWRRPSHDPHVIYAPPMVYAPPPMEQSPGLNLVFPLNFH